MQNALAWVPKKHFFHFVFVFFGSIVLVCMFHLIVFVLQCVVVCCNVLQCVAVCCSVLQCAAVCCSVLQCAAVCCSLIVFVISFVPFVLFSALSSLNCSFLHSRGLVCADAQI